MDYCDFETGRGWLLEAEAAMTKIFETSVGSHDTEAIDEIRHYVGTFGPAGVEDTHIIRFAARRIRYAIHVKDIIQMLIAAGEFRIVGEGYGHRRIAAIKDWSNVDAASLRPSPE
jgi:hypothetical protein